MPAIIKTTNRINRKISLGFIITSLVAISPVLAQTPTFEPGTVQPQFDRMDLPSEPSSPELDIPSVPERPLDTDQGPKIQVSNIQLQDFTPVAGTNINRASLDVLISEQLASSNDGFTVGQLQDIANNITQFYRLEGLVLARIILPEQDVKRDGIVKMRVFPGILGQVTTANNKSHSPKKMTAAFQEYVGLPVQVKQIESGLLLTDDLPGLEAFGVFRPGEKLGETQLVLNASKEDKTDLIVIADNHGSETTGNHRLLASLSINNLSGLNDSTNNLNGLSDQLNVTVLKTFSPEEANYGGIDYKLPITPKLWAGGFYNINDYQIGNEFLNSGNNAFNFDVSGKTESYGIYGLYKKTRSRNYNDYARLTLSHKKAEAVIKATTNLGATTTLVDGEDELTVLSIETGFDAIDTFAGGGINEASVTISVGFNDYFGATNEAGDGSLRTGGSGTKAPGNFEKIGIQFERLQAITQGQSLYLRFNGQYSKDLLSSIEQFSIGGPNSVRAYPVSEYIRDSASFVSAEWIFNAPGFADKDAFLGKTWGELLQVSIFVDYAQGYINDPADNQQRDIELSGAGIGLEMSVAKQFFLRIDAATPISNDDASNKKNPQFWLSAGYQF